MSRKRREIILDFTSLLDVTMILLFFFVLNATLNSRQAVEKAEEQAQASMQAAEEREAQADAEWQKASEALAEAEEQLALLKQEDADRGAYIQGVLDFEDGLGLELKLTGEGESWTLGVSAGGESGKISDVRNKTAEELEEAIAPFVEQYGNETAILCMLLYDSAEDGSRKAKENVEDALEQLKEKHQYLFYLPTDISFEEE